MIFPQRWRQQTQHQTNSMGDGIGSLLVSKVITHLIPGSTTWDRSQNFDISFPIYNLGLKPSFQAINKYNRIRISILNEWKGLGR